MNGWTNRKNWAAFCEVYGMTPIHSRYLVKVVLVVYPKYEAEINKATEKPLERLPTR